MSCLKTLFCNSVQVLDCTAHLNRRIIKLKMLLQFPAPRQTEPWEESAPHKKLFVTYEKVISLLGSGLCFPRYFIQKRMAQSSTKKVAHDQCCCFLTGLLPLSKKCSTLLIPQEGKKLSKPQKVMNIVTISWELHSLRLLSTARRKALVS